MSDEHALRRDIDRAAKARAVSEDPIIVEAFKALRDAYTTAWRDTSPKDTDARERLWIATTVLTKVEGHIASVIANGELAKRELDELEGKKKLLGLF